MSKSALAPAAPARSHMPWRERPLLPLQLASEIAGISTASIYRLEDQGLLRLRRIAGRTLVQTDTLITLIENAEHWTPSDRGKEARAKRTETARSAWQR